jgi:hypothetical protein
MKLQRILQTSDIEKLGLSQIGAPASDIEMSTGHPLEDLKLDEEASWIAYSNQIEKPTHYMCSVKEMPKLGITKVYLYAFVFYAPDMN